MRTWIFLALEMERKVCIFAHSAMAVYFRAFWRVVQMHVFGIMFISEVSMLQSSHTWHQLPTANSNLKITCKKGIRALSSVFKLIIINRHTGFKNKTKSVIQTITAENIPLAPSHTNTPHPAYTHTPLLSLTRHTQVIQ